jgi:hypothetical protein
VIGDEEEKYENLITTARGNHRLRFYIEEVIVCYCYLNPVVCKYHH